jgi:hypothetical protein
MRETPELWTPLRDASLLAIGQYMCHRGGQTVTSEAITPTIVVRITLVSALIADIL